MSSTHPIATGREIVPLDVSVVVPARNARQTLARCLDALKSAEPAPREVIVVLDGADAELSEIATTFGAKLIQLQAARGPAAARNAGVEAATGRILLFVDADVAIAPGAVGEAVRALREHPEWSAVFGSYDADPGETNFVSQYKGLLNHFVHQSSLGEASTFWTAMGAVHRDVFLKLGGFDQSSRLEDIEFGYRLRAAGYRIGLNRNMLAKHLKRWTTPSLIHSDIFDRALPWTELIFRYRNSARDLNLDRTNRLSVISAFALVVAALAAPFQAPLDLSIVALAIAMLLILNSRLYLFFLRRRGFIFLCGAIAYHWLYLLYGGVAFLVGWMRHIVARKPIRIESPNPATAGAQ